MTRTENTPRTSFFKDKFFVVDKLHYQGHKGEQCAKHCDPKLYDVIMQSNTVVVEQINSWAGAYKFCTKHT